MKEIEIFTYNHDISETSLEKLKPLFIDLIKEKGNTIESLKKDLLWTIDYDVIKKHFTLSNRESVDAKVYNIYSTYGCKEFDGELYDKLYKENENLLYSFEYKYELYQAIEPDYYLCDECPVYLYEDLNTTIEKVEKSKFELLKKHDEKLLELYVLKNDKKLIPLK